MSGYSDDEWEEIGQAWLHASGQGDRDRPDALQFVRWLKHAGYIRDYICVADADLPTADGKFNPEEARVYYRQSVWNAAERGVPHAVWTIWHEASHAIQKHQQERYRSNTARKSRLSSSTGKDEFEANRLAACLAAPFDKSGYCLGTTADDLCRKFNLSRPAGERRLVEFERMYRRKHNVRRELPADVFDFLTRQKKKGYDVRSIGDIESMLPTPQNRYEGDACPCCGAFMLVRSGLSRKCERCSAKMGED